MEDTNKRYRIITEDINDLKFLKKKYSEEGKDAKVAEIEKELADLEKEKEKLEKEGGIEDV